MAAQKFNCKIEFLADNAENAKVKKAVLQNIVDNVSENAFINILYAKIRKDPSFFKKLADNPLLRML